jgi:predicted rRNA methylase YqxC with S4 and FtsJ domains
MSETLNQNRVRMNFTTNAKGFAQMDITVEFPTVDESKEAMDKAIKALKDVLKENNIAEVSTN